MADGGASRDAVGTCRLPACTLAVMLLLAGPMASARADTPVVDVFEDDGLPQTFPQYPDMYLWRYIFENNSDTQPPGNPYNENMAEAEVLEVYSSQRPIFVGGLQPGWYGLAADGSLPYLWNILFITNEPEKEVTPGQTGTFEVATFLPPGSQTNTGPLTAQGFLQTAPTEPVEVVGPVPPPREPVVDVHEDDGVPQVISISPETDLLLWTYVFENNSDAQPPGNPYNENMVELTIRNLYSVGEPTYEGGTAGWAGFYTPGDAPGLWNMTLSTDLPDREILPGQSSPFCIATYIPAGFGWNTGTLFAQGYLQTLPTEPVEVVGPAGFWVPGDADGDGDVDCLDYLAWKAHAGADAGAGREEGDFDHDGDVDRDDFLILQANFGYAPIGQGAFPPADHAPEPAALWLLALAGPAALRRRRR